MTDLTEQSTWPDGIYQIKTTDPVLGGPPNLQTKAGLSNIQAQQLAHRGQFLKGLAMGAHRCVEALINDPPAAPVVGGTWVIGAAPTGAWAGHANEIAVWAGESWHYATAPNGLIAIDAVGAAHQWDQNGAAWIAWVAGENLAGPVQFATEAEVLAGAIAGKAVSPAMLAKALGKSADGLPLHLELRNSGEATQSIPNDVATRCDNLVAVGGNLGGQWNGHRFTVDADSLGVYGILNRLNTNGETGEGAQTWKNGINVRDYQLSTSAGSANVVPFTHFVNLLAVGDYIEFYHSHKSSSSKNNMGSEAQVYRLLPYAPV